MTDEERQEVLLLCRHMSAGVMAGEIVRLRKLVAEPQSLDEALAVMLDRAIEQARGAGVKQELKVALLRLLPQMAVAGLWIEDRMFAGTTCTLRSIDNQMVVAIFSRSSHANPFGAEVFWPDGSSFDRQFFDNEEEVIEWCEKTAQFTGWTLLGKVLNG